MSRLIGLSRQDEIGLQLNLLRNELDLESDIEPVIHGWREMQRLVARAQLVERMFRDKLQALSTRPAEWDRRSIEKRAVRRT